VDFMRVFLNQLLSFGKSLGLEAVVRVQFHRRLDPELGLALGVLHMHVRPRLLAREEVEAKPRSKLQKRVGRLADEDMIRLNRAVLVFLGLAGRP
jgi:hypothetical protein